MTPNDIRDIRPLISIPALWPWIALAVLGLLLAAACVLGIRAWRKRARRPLTPEEQANEALTRAEVLARAGQCHEWAEIVAATLRGALAARLGHAACPETTSELARVDWTQAPAGAAVDATTLIALLSTCDLTRFALGRLEPSALLSSTDSARAWVAQLFAPLKPTPSTPAEATS